MIPKGICSQWTQSYYNTILKKKNLENTRLQNSYQCHKKKDRCLNNLAMGKFACILLFGTVVNLEKKYFNNFSATTSLEELTADKTKEE